MSGIYTSAREGILSGAIRWMTDDIRVMLVSSGYVFNEAHERLAELSQFAMGSSGTINGRSAFNGVADAADISVVADAQRELGGLVVYRKGFGDPLVVYITHDGPEFIPQVGQIVDIEWNNGSRRIFNI
jgi:hypothetical protein